MLVRKQTTKRVTCVSHFDHQAKPGVDGRPLGSEFGRIQALLSTYLVDVMAFYSFVSSS